MRHFPAFLDLHGRSAVVVGGEAPALNKVRLLLDAGARVTVVARRIGADLQALWVAGEIGLKLRAFAEDDLSGHALACSTTGIAAVDEAVARAAHARGLLLNVVDRPDISSFIMPAVVDRDPVTVAVSSGGAAPTLVRLLRERLEALLPERLGALARFAERFRPAVRAAFGGPARRGFWEDFFRGPLAARVLAGDESGAAGRMLVLVNARPERSAVGRVALVGAGPGSADLLTLRALQLLHEADVIVHDRLVGETVLGHARRDAARVAVGKRRGEHTLPQAEINALLVRLAGDGKRVVRLKGGDPFVFGRGGEEADALRRAGIDIEIVPGVTAALGSAARTAIPLTHRGIAHAVTFVTAERGDGSTPDWAAIAALRQTIVVYMGIGAAATIARELVAHGLPAATPCAIVENATLPDERAVAGRLADLPRLIADHAIAGPATIIVGEVVSHGAIAAEPARGEPLRLAVAR